MFDEIIKHIESKIMIKHHKEDLKTRLIFAYDNGFEELLNNLKTNRNVLPFITELNLIYDLSLEFKDNSINFAIKYEEINNLGAPDLLLELDNIKLCIQVKRFMASEIDNKNSNSLKLITDELSNINIGLFYHLEHDILITNNDSREFINFIKENKDIIVKHGCTKGFKCSSGKNIVIEFRKPPKLNLKHLTLGSVIPEPRWTGEEIQKRITASTNKALKSMIRNDNVINCIFAENRDLDEIDFGNILYGHEQEVFYNQTYMGWNRKNDGLILEDDIKNKLDFYVILNRKMVYLVDITKVYM